MDSNPEMPGRPCIEAPHDEREPRRVQTDRRTRPTSPSDALRWRGRRGWPRRREERAGAFFVDRFDALTLAVAVTLLVLTITDGVFTIELLDTNSEEMNPLMASLLLRGHQAFLVGKYILTAAGVPFLVVYKNHPLFRTRFRVGFLLPIFVGMYLALIIYQARLLEIGRGVTWPSRPCLSPAHQPKRPIGESISRPAKKAEARAGMAIHGDASPGETDVRDPCSIRPMWACAIRKDLDANLAARPVPSVGFSMISEHANTSG